MANTMCLIGIVATAIGLWMVHPSLSLVAMGVLVTAAGGWLHVRKTK